MLPHLFAGIRVSDFAASRPWYQRLLGEPTFFPHATEAVWTLADERSVYIVEHPQGAGQSVLMIFVENLDAEIERLAAHGLTPDEIEAHPGAVRKAVYRDPDGNEIGIGGAG